MIRQNGLGNLALQFTIYASLLGGLIWLGMQHWLLFLGIMMYASAWILMNF